MILITGASGFVGRYLMQTVPGAVAAPSLKAADRETVERILGDFPGDTILHTAAISDIGACRADPEGSYRANVQLPLWIAQGAAGRKLICFSSDQVYSGSPEAGPYTEDRTAPGNLYAAHKLEMEQRVLDVLPESVMLRAEWMYDLSAPGRVLSSGMFWKGLPCAWQTTVFCPSTGRTREALMKSARAAHCREIRCFSNKITPLPQSFPGRAYPLKL